MPLPCRASGGSSTSPISSTSFCCPFVSCMASVKICFACGGQRWFVSLMAVCLPAAPLAPIHAYARVPRAQIAGKLRRRDSLQMELLRSCWLPLWLVGCFDARVLLDAAGQGRMPEARPWHHAAGPRVIPRCVAAAFCGCSPRARRGALWLLSLFASSATVLRVSGSRGPRAGRGDRAVLRCFGLKIFLACGALRRASGAGESAS